MFWLAPRSPRMVPSFNQASADNESSRWPASQDCSHSHRWSQTDPALRWTLAHSETMIVYVVRNQALASECDSIDSISHFQIVTHTGCGSCKGDWRPGGARAGALLPPHRRAWQYTGRQCPRRRPPWPP